MRIVFGMAALAFLAFGCAAAAGDLAAFDTDRDGLLSEQEAESAGWALFDRLDVNRSGTLDAGELGGRIGDQVLRAADVTADAQLDREEYRGLLEARFKSANGNGDGAVDELELDALPGALLLVMIRP